MNGSGGGKLGFGTGGLLRIGSARERQNVLAAAVANGITHFDTAPIYGFGEAERSIGRFLRRERSRLTVATKFGLTPSPLAMRLAPLQRLARRAIAKFPALRRAALENAVAAMYLEAIAACGVENTGEMLRAHIEIREALRTYLHLKYDDAAPDDWFDHFVLMARPYIREKVRLTRLSGCARLNEPGRRPIARDRRASRSPAVRE